MNPDWKETGVSYYNTYFGQTFGAGALTQVTNARNGSHVREKDRIVYYLVLSTTQQPGRVWIQIDQTTKGMELVSARNGLIYRAFSTGNPTTYFFRADTGVPAMRLPVEGRFKI